MVARQSMSAELHRHHLDKNDPGSNPYETPWWRELQPWPPGIHFEDVPKSELLAERTREWRENRTMPRAPAPDNAIGCATAMCEMSRFAGIE